MAEEAKKFYRSRKDRVFFGVCGGLGEYFGYDPVLFRLLFVLLFLMNGVGLLLYIIMVFVTTEEPGRSDKGGKDLEGEVNELAKKVDDKAKEISREANLNKDGMKESGNILGIIIILVGLFFLSREVLPMAWLSSNIVWALLIIALGVYIIFKK